MELKIEYDKDADAAYIRLKPGEIVQSQAVHSGIVLDIDASGSVLGIEVLDLSQRTQNPFEPIVKRIGE